MEINTASAAISFARKLEEESARFYEELSRRYAKDKDIFLSFAKENGKNIVQVERAYYEAITDALEGCFSFKINPDDYAFKTEVADRVSYSEALERSIEIEGKIIKFYSAAAEQSESLMADVPRAFTFIAKKRDNRRSIVKSLQDKGMLHLASN
jgi:rubrerythrin